MRPTWDEYFMEVAQVVAKRSTCRRRQIGAIIVKDKRILASGYNGAPSGLPHCEDYGCLREEMGVPSGERHEICRALHAEQNAIVQAARHGISVNGATIYTTVEPCVLCAKMLINAGIEKIVYRDPYPDDLAREMVGQAGLKVERYGLPGSPSGGACHGVDDGADRAPDGAYDGAPDDACDGGRSDPPEGDGDD